MKKHNLTGVSFSRIALVDKGASYDTATGDGAYVLLFKRATADGDDTMTLAEIIKALEALKPEEKESLKKALGAAPAPEDILKNADPAVRAIVEKAQADAKAANDRAAANETAIAELKKADRKASLRKRVDVYASLSGDVEALAAILGCVEDSMGEEAAKKFEETLKAWDSQIKKGALAGPKGSRGTGETPEGGNGSVAEEVIKRARALVQKDSTFTLEKAIAKVYEEDPSLYNRNAAETEGQGNADKA